ncbi:cob(I)yrinic acid a,c-diamide adenosyltransferase [Hydrogenophaga sp. 5NK40-0174]|uniref:cob(I)yrinic acid a,c-diamide adenosyltransferase n=1 Tax=Hydrogenophaga sp. 5NK40-0174 TaxID=3127649 RepID=UPI00310B05F8
MEIETPPTDRNEPKPDGERRGLVMVHTGDGKGKSTAAFGLAMRAFGRTHVHGKKVKIFQFMKVPSARFGEHRVFEMLSEMGPPVAEEIKRDKEREPIIQGLGDGFSWKSKDLDHSAQLARDGWERAKAAIMDGEHFLVVLDEITYPLIYGWLPLEDVLQTLKDRPRDVTVCLTGRRCPQEIIDLADTVTEMTMVKHAYKAGIPAQRGIED